MGEEDFGSSSSSAAIDSSNIGFQLLKKHGWKEGTGLGVSEQGRLEPVQAHLKSNKRGLGAEVKRKNHKSLESVTPKGKQDKEQQPSKKSKALSKKMRKMQEIEKRMQEKEFDRAFFREFWPDNV
ncbi:G patch domain and ankyrin repeat-containing protein 1 homolog [Tripterygium wilfordii]|uniref:G patch domain and ankyrin repeat-containing protein 1 homolog n=1 Tax=Tripterygium wilfordii TaxID=458696 RepID=UPI0018F832FF|nr:G patch domain and ankyrin repeat-containing protein 1 homolog [Tripterygium wilfordii]